MGASQSERWSEQKHRAWTTHRLETGDTHQRDRQRDLSLQPLPCLGPESGRCSDGKPMSGNGRWEEGGDGPSCAASRTGPEGLCEGLGEGGQGRAAGLWPRGRGRGRQGGARGVAPSLRLAHCGVPRSWSHRGGRLAGPTLRPPTRSSPLYLSSTPGLGPSTPAPALGQSRPQAKTRGDPNLHPAKAPACRTLPALRPDPLRLRRG